MGIVGLIFVNRSFGSSLWQALRRPNRSLSWVLAGVALILTLSLVWPAARSLFGFGALDLGELLLAALAGVSVLLILEQLKRPFRGALNG